MSLSEKLSQMSQELQAKKEIEELSIMDAELVPTREKIKNLEELKSTLLFILESLNFKPEENNTFGMKNYTEKVVADKSNSNEHLGSLLNEHKEVLSTHGIDTVEKLAESDIADETPEINEYKNANKAESELSEADNSLLNKLSELGIIDNNDIEIKSLNGIELYNKASFLIENKLEDINEEILLNKIKTPEGKKEAINEISQFLSDEISDSHFSKYKNRKGEEELSLGINVGRIVVGNDYAKFEGGVGDYLIPSFLSVYDIKYGKEIAKEALKNAYSLKIDSAFTELDKERNNIDNLAEEDLERSSLEKWKEAKESYDNYNERADELRSLLNLKAEELNAIGISFNPNYLTGYGGTYEDLLELSEYSSDNKTIKESLDYGINIYPPALYFDSLKEFIEKRRGQLNEIILAIDNLKTEDDVYNLTQGRDPVIGKIHKDILRSGFDNSRRSKNNQNSKLHEFKSFDEAKEYFSNINAERVKTKSRIIEVVDTAIEFQEVKSVLTNELKNEGWNTHLSNIDSEIRSIEIRKEEAIETLDNLMRLSIDIPDEEVILNGSNIIVVSIKKEMDETNEKGKETEFELLRAENEYRTKLHNKPKIFGVGSWQKELDEMDSNINNLKKEVQYLRNDKYSELLNKSRFYVKTPEYSYIRKVLESIPEIKGSKENIMKILTDKISEVINRKVPENIIEFNEEYKALSEKLYK